MNEIISVIKKAARNVSDEVILLYCDDPNLLHPKSRLFGQWTRLYIDDQKGWNRVKDVLKSAPEDATMKVVFDGNEKVYHRKNGKWLLWYERYQYDVILPDLPKGQVTRWKGLRNLIPVESVDDLPVGSIVTCRDGITYVHCTKLADGMWRLSGKEIKHWEVV